MDQEGTGEGERGGGAHLSFSCPNRSPGDLLRRSRIIARRAARRSAAPSGICPFGIVGQPLADDSLRQAEVIGDLPMCLTLGM